MINTVQYDSIQYNIMQCNAIQYSTTPFQRNQWNAVQYMYNTVNAMQRNPTQHNRIQYNTTQNKIMHAIQSNTLCIEIVNNCILISVFQFYYFKWIKKWRDNEIANQKARKNKNPEL